MTERLLQQEILTRLKSWPLVAISVPNSIYFPARTDEERRIIARVVSQMKNAGSITPGAPDLALFWHGGAAMVEIKRPASRDLLGAKKPAGRPSDAQKDMAARCAELGVNHAYVTSWDELRGHLTEWGVPAQ